MGPLGFCERLVKHGDPSRAYMCQLFLLSKLVERIDPTHPLTWSYD